MNISDNDISIVIPAKNESSGLKQLIPDLKDHYPEAEIIVVNDGSTDNTSELLREYGVTEINHPYSKGNGAAIKSGARTAGKDWIIFMDGDGQHRQEDVGRLLVKAGEGYDMVVGARKELKHQANIFRGLANRIYNRLASYMVKSEVEDLTSGMRLVNRNKFLRFLDLLPNGFSYPTTSTMAFFRSGFSVAYVPIEVKKRIGNSHINLVKDGVRFLLIIFKIATLYSPLKLFFPVSFCVFLLGVLRYAYTYITVGTFTNMSATLMISALLIFLIGLVSEQVASLIYMSLKNNNDEA